MINARRAVKSKTVPQLHHQPALLPSPGVLILSMTLEPLYITPSAHKFLAELDGETVASSDRKALPLVVQDVCSVLRHDDRPYSARTDWDKMQVRHLAQTAYGTILIRGYGILENHGGQNGRFLILLEMAPAGLSVNERLEETDCQFTTRQRGILNGLALGLTNKEIAERMTISVHTVKEYVRQLMMKLHTGSRTGIVARVAGLTVPSPRAPGQQRSHGVAAAIQEK